MSMAISYGVKGPEDESSKQSDCRDTFEQQLAMENLISLGVGLLFGAESDI